MEKPNLKNKTSTVPADRSISKIERLLVDVGANNINKQYVGGVLLIGIPGINREWYCPKWPFVHKEKIKGQVKA